MEQTHRTVAVIAESSPTILWATDQNGRVSFANDAYERYFGVSLAERGEGSSGLIHPEDATSHGESFTRAVRLRRPFHAVARVRRADGQWRWMESWGAPRFSDQERFMGMVGSSAEVLDSAPRSPEPVDDLGTALQAQTRDLRELVARLERGDLDRAKQLATLVHDGLQRLRLAHRSRRGHGSGGGGTGDSRQVSPQARVAPTPLTPREGEIVELLLFHGRVRLVAEALGLSHHTVRNHLRSVFRKFGVHSQVELLRRLRQHRR